MLQGKALSVEDAADVLSLKDNDSSLEDYVTAVHLISRAPVSAERHAKAVADLVSVQSLPEARQISAVKTIWRRIYIHDEYVYTSVSQTTPNDCQQLEKNTANS